MVSPEISRAAVEAFSYVDTVVGALVGAAIAAVFASTISVLRVRSKFDDLIARQRQRCRPLFDDAEFTLDDSLERHTLQVLERAREEIAPA